MDQIRLVLVLRVRDPLTRSAVRGRLADIGLTAVTENIWELPHYPDDDPDLRTQLWEEELRWLEETIDPRTDVIYLWSAEGGTLLRSAIGGAR